MKKSDFYYDLPKELIAQTPIERREKSRMLHMDRQSGAIRHRRFFELAATLREGDCLVLNDSRVMPARLLGKTDAGGTAEVVLLRKLNSEFGIRNSEFGERSSELGTQISEFGERNSKYGIRDSEPEKRNPELSENGSPTNTGSSCTHATAVYECLVKPGRKIKPGSQLIFGNGELTAFVTEATEDGNRIIQFHNNGSIDETLERFGKMPLPPYIQEELEDAERYQTVYSKTIGSAAAPTAGLHFTDELLDLISGRGVEICFVTLHVGLGTFRPVRADEVEDHKMHAECFIIPDKTADIINRTKKNGGRVIAVGTTSCRTLESQAGDNGRIAPFSGFTDIFIYPGYNFKCIDGLITNFHLPESTLIMLVSAFAGRENVLNAYSEAIRERYRFYSFGDAMLIL